MTYLRAVLYLTFVVGLLTSPTWRDVAHAQDARQKQIIEQLGPAGLVHIPDSLEEAVGRFPAAVVAEIEGFGDLELRPVRSTGGTLLGNRGYAAYQVRIVDVLYNKLGKAAPPLVAGQRVKLTQVVGREEATAFATRRTIVQNKDRCLVYLWHSAGANEWSMISWPLQFRQSTANARYAETVLPNQDVKWLEGRRLAVLKERDRVNVDWALLVEEIRTVGNAKR